MLNKLNMAIGAFFSEIGTEFMRFFSKLYKSSHEIDDKLALDDRWSEKIIPTFSPWL